MTFSIPLLILILTIVSWFVSLPKLFAKASENASAGYIPGYNFWIWQKITSRPWWWILIVLVPGVGFLMLMIMHVQLTWSFGQRDTKSTLLAIFAPFYQLPKMAFDEKVQYTGNIDWDKKKKGTAREWGDAILFALIAAFIIRTFTFEAFTIPTPSMEESMLVGDYLFVNKLKYGARVPNTPIAFPLAHHTIPILNTKAYLEWMKLDYNRLPGWADVGRGDAVVFNFPEGDTVLVQMQNQSYYQIRRSKAILIAKNQKTFEKNPQKYLKKAARALELEYDVIVRPTDKQDNYVKRCVAIPGDTLEIIDRDLFVNGKLQDQYENTQHAYILDFKEKYNQQKREYLKNELGINHRDISVMGGSLRYLGHLTDKQVVAMEKLPWVSKITVFNDSKENSSNSGWKVFPNAAGNTWTGDNFGPLYVPKAGATIELTKENIDRYKRVITAYEDNSMAIKEDGVYINGEKTDTYTFKMDYYWMMGDNRDNSLDSRYWGFVPEDHIVGQAAFVWFSRDAERGLSEKGGIRWNRLFTKVK